MIIIALPFFLKKSLKKVNVCFLLCQLSEGCLHKFSEILQITLVGMPCMKRPHRAFASEGFLIYLDVLQLEQSAHLRHRRLDDGA